MCGADRFYTSLAVKEVCRHALEKHHIERKSKGGSNADKNLLLVHLHCHDQLHRVELMAQEKVLVVH
ncbi:HNH endonuclease [Gloeothece verrucosa]|uniref:HNH endonuclease n=1 Tax=Gloeothece verrucosa TaxID=2546359 RepID=UPI000A01E80F